MPAEDPETALLRIVELVKTRIPKRFGLNSIRDVHERSRVFRFAAEKLIVEQSAAAAPPQASDIALRTPRIKGKEMSVLIEALALAAPTVEF